MKILAIADEESRYLWDFYEPGKLKDIDLIISCGDLNPDYLMFLVTLSNVPVLYVHGNHDEKYETKPPEGCVCIEDDIFVFKGVRILGLGGSMRYRPGKHQYTDAQMNRRVRKLWWKLWRKKGFDILVTHAPAYQLNDGMDLPHQGFTAFRSLMEKYKPKYFLHGHVHLNYGRRHKRYDQYEETQVVNAFERCIIEYDETK
ncbi:MAG: metallophosphoesterase [Ruminococcus sp.]|nr:metallophosphoesterase [Ruminococcus sp.]